MEEKDIKECESSKEWNCLEMGLVKSEVVAEDSQIRRYSRSEMEGLRFVELDEQQRKWSYVYQKLGSDVAKEYDGLRAPNGRNRNKQNKNKNKNGNKQLHVGKKHDASESEMCSSEIMEGSVVLNICDDTLGYTEPFDDYDAADDEADSSSDECNSIQRPAFYVEGEPDFESGPPLDGLEYLRRVRWEAAQIPKVKVVKLQASKITTEQTLYMPQIPEVAKCLPNLLPSKLWEDAFLAEFSEIRQVISLLEEPCSEQSVIKDNKGPRREQSDCTQQPNKTNPSLSSILSMDVLSRSSALRKSISKLETASSLSRDDCVWLFSLCAAVDTPLSAETCASLRCLLRKCSSLLALKSEQDDEVAMLSILVAIAGKYFRQSDNI